MTTAEYAAQALSRCDLLAAYSDSSDHLTRTFLGPAMHPVHAAVGEWMEQAGMTVYVDAVGSIRGRFPAAGDTPRVLVIGSHLDTVPNAGKYDGILGVTLAIAAVAARQGRRLPFAIEVIGFSEEEGVRFAAPYLGSLARTGGLPPSLMDRRDAAGISVTEAIRDFGLDPAEMPAAYDPGETLIGYIEVHIEQGPVLDEMALPLGIVSAIAGQSRCRMILEGQAGHAGTTPMAGRRDALAGSAEFVLAAESLAADFPELAATVGRLEVQPNASNVIPGTVTLSLDVRHAADDVRLAALQQIKEAGQAIAKRRRLNFRWETASEQAAVPMDRELMRLLTRAVQSAGLPAPTLVSGAGHDAAIMARIAPAALLFLRSPGGISHHPAESVQPADVETALRVLSAFLDEVASEEPHSQMKAE